MKAVLIYMPCNITANGLKSNNIPPLALYVLSSCLKENKIDTDIINEKEFETNEIENITTHLKNVVGKHINDMDVVCLSVNTFNWSITKRLCSIIKRMRKVTIIVGGVHATQLYQNIIQDVNIDYVIRGSGENILPKLIKTINSGKNPSGIPRISYKKDGCIIHTDNEYINEESAKKIIYPDFQALPEYQYEVAPIETSRGCMYNCIFCSISLKRQRKLFSILEIDKQIEWAKKNTSKFCDLKTILFTDDCFTTEELRAREILEMLNEKEDEYKYFFEARVNDLLSDNLLEVMRPNIISGIQIGIECGYDAGIRKVGKGTSIKNLYLSAKKLYQYKINRKAVYSFIIGFPWETEKEIHKTLDTVESLCEKYGIVASINWLMLLPSMLYRDRKKYDIMVEAEIWDAICWEADENVFWKTHPTINPKILSQIEARIERMKLKGYDIMHSFPFFTSENIINYIFEEQLN